MSEGLDRTAAPGQQSERHKINELREIIRRALGKPGVPERILSFIGEMEAKYPDLYVDTFQLYQVLTTRDPFLGHVTAFDLPGGEIETFIRSLHQ